MMAWKHLTVNQAEAARRFTDAVSDLLDEHRAQGLRPAGALVALLETMNQVLQEDPEIAEILADSLFGSTVEPTRAAGVTPKTKRTRR